MKIQKKSGGRVRLGGGGGGGGRVGLGCQDCCERRIELFVKIKKNSGGSDGGSSWVGGGVGGGLRVDVNEELKFL